MKLSDDNLRELISANLVPPVGKPFPHRLSDDHTSPKRNADNNMVQQSINNLSAELTSMM